MTYQHVEAVLANFTSAYSCSTPPACDAVNITAVDELAVMLGPNGAFAQYGPAAGPYYSLNALASGAWYQCGVRRLAEYAVNAGLPAYLYNYRKSLYSRVRLG